MNKIKFFILFSLLSNVCISQKVLEYLKSDNFRDLSSGYGYDEGRIIDSLLQFSLSFNDTINSKLIWYNHLSAEQNPFESHDSTKYCSLKFKAYAWIKIILYKQEKDIASFQNKIFVITDRDGEKLHDYRISKNEGQIIYIRDKSKIHLTKSIDDEMKRWQLVLRNKGINFIRQNDLSLPFNGYFIKNWIPG